jgi:hypothetical protein
MLLSASPSVTPHDSQAPTTMLVRARLAIQTRLPERECAAQNAKEKQQQSRRSGGKEWTAAMQRHWRVRSAECLGSGGGGLADRWSGIWSGGSGGCVAKDTSSRRTQQQHAPRSTSAALTWTGVVRNPVQSHSPALNPTERLSTFNPLMLISLASFGCYSECPPSTSGCRSDQEAVMLMPIYSAISTRILSHARRGCPARQSLLPLGSVARSRCGQADGC